MENRPNFCAQCGAQLDDADSFCVRCGKEIGSAPSATAAPAYVQQVSSKRSTTLWVIFFLGLLWGVNATYSGIDIILNAKDILDLVDISVFEDAGIDPQMLVDMMTAIGAIILISGILALITAVLVFMRKFHTIALICCIISSILALIALVGIIGLIVAYFLNKSKNEFTPTKV